MCAGGKFWNRGQSSVISDSLVFLSYHNIDSRYAFALAHPLIRYYRAIWLDRLEIGPLDDWRGMLDAALERSAQALVIVSDDWLESACCRREYATLRERRVPIIAVVARDFSAAEVADFEFDDWIDCRRFFAQPSDQNLSALLNQIPEARQPKATGDRAEYLRQFIAALELSLGRMSPAFAAMLLRQGQSHDRWRHRAYPSRLLTEWAFDAGDNPDAAHDLLSWTEREGRFILRGPAGAGLPMFARMLALHLAHAALRDKDSPMPFWLDLATWDESRASLDTFIESQWHLISYWKHWLGGNDARFVIDGWDDLAERAPNAAAAFSRWIESEPRHGFVLLADGLRAQDPDLPTLSAKPLTAASAQQYAKACLPIDKASDFRHLLQPRQAFVERNPLDYLALGVEFMAVDRALVVNEWRRDPMRTLIDRRLARFRDLGGEIDRDELVLWLRQLAWKMQASERHRLINRELAAPSRAEKPLLQAALETGILTAHGDLLRFQSPLFQWHLASGFISPGNLVDYLSAPQFVAGERVATKWDGIIKIVIDKAEAGERARLIETIAKVDPFLAHDCARRGEHNPGLQEQLVKQLIAHCAKDGERMPALLTNLADMADVAAALSVLTREMSHYDQTAQLRLWSVCLALPVDLPLEFVEIVAAANREPGGPTIKQVSAYPLSLAVAYLVKLARNEDEGIRSNAIWILGEIKYLPTAALLLDWLENDKAEAKGEMALALMKYAYSDILSRLLRWSQGSPEGLAATRSALSLRGRLVTSRLLLLASEGKLTLQPQCYELMVDRDEADLALGLAALAGDTVELPAGVKNALSQRTDAEALRNLVGSGIKHLPNRDSFAQLVKDIDAVLTNPPESTVIAGSGLGALLYGNQRLDELRAASAESKDTSGTARRWHAGRAGAPRAAWRNQRPHQCDPGIGDISAADGIAAFAGLARRSGCGSAHRDAGGAVTVCDRRDGAQSHHRGALRSRK